jgi:hypothetical protein
MFKRFTLPFLVIMFSISSAFSQAGGGGSIKGKVLDELSEGMPFVNVAIYQFGNMKGGATTDMDGRFKLSNLEAGSYDLEVKFVGYQTYRVEGLVVKSGKLLPLDPMQLKEADEMLDEVEVVFYKVPLIDKDGGASGGTVTREDLARMPGRSAASIATTVGGVQTDGNGEISSVRGSRDDATYYYIDGIKVRGGTSLPKAAIEEVSVMTGGLPANYGDATGGIISITTRGASRFYFGGVEAVSSGFKIGENTYGLDNFGYNLFEGVLSGPLFMKKDSTGEKTDPILGFFLSANFQNIVDSRPFAIDQYRLKPSMRDSLIASPLRPTGLGFGAFYNTDFLTPNDFEKVSFRQNNGNTRASLAAKIDVNTGPNVNLTFGGSGSYASRTNASWRSALFNYDNYAQITDLEWRVYGKFTQRFQQVLEEGEQPKKGGIQNAFYTLMVDYSEDNQYVGDNIHGDNYFNYGYIGKFEIEKENSYEFSDHDGNGTIDRVQSGVNDVEVTFTPSDVNADVAAITSQYFNLYDNVEGNYENFTQLLDGNALINGMAPANVYGLWDNVGTAYNFSSKRNETQFRVTGIGSADVGDHAISVGFEFEQRTDRLFQVRNPNGLWEVGRLLANKHTDNGRALDPNNASLTYFGSFLNVDFATLNSAPGDYDPEDAQSYFDYNVRQALGWNPDGTAFVNIDALNPNDLSLEMFSADELLNNGGSQALVTYYGYDHTGKKLKGSVSFDDFFTKQDDDKNLLRSIGAFEPIYISGYIMDKFSFDDLIFNVGLRIDRFDANQSVLKDEYLLYNARTVAEVTQFNGSDILHPTNIPTNAIVYVDDVEQPTSINGYRSGNQWYTSEGIAVNDLEDIIPSGYVIPQPYLAEGVEPTDDISSDAFEDYKPQINIMPRIAFSFPISDEALFFAHYDVLTKRPTTGNRLDPTDYFYLSTGNVSRVDNPNLQPEKTIDYELGFQQALNKNSALKISGFYREMRNMVTLVNRIGAYPQTYTTWGNIDFGTVKGLTVQYDLRRTGNITMRTAYTLQFADGTGSNPTAAANLIASDQPNLRTIYPLSFDQRHQIVTTMDYRYGDGKDYNGPMIGGKKIFKNTGANLVANFASGTPYSRQERITGSALINPPQAVLEGEPFGSRKPWQFRADLQIDKNIILKFGEEKSKSANLNIYLLVRNLFNTTNILSINRFTGNPDDDGYLNAAEFQNAISTQNDEETFRYYYAMKVNDPNNYGIPRQIRLGVKLDF